MVGLENKGLLLFLVRLILVNFLDRHSLVFLLAEENGPQKIQQPDQHCKEQYGEQNHESVGRAVLIQIDVIPMRRLFLRCEQERAEVALNLVLFHRSIVIDLVGIM